jgi:hypothetical protein
MNTSTRLVNSVMGLCTLLDLPTRTGQSFSLVVGHKLIYTGRLLNPRICKWKRKHQSYQQCYPYLNLTKVFRHMKLHVRIYCLLYLECIGCHHHFLPSTNSKSDYLRNLLVRHLEDMKLQPASALADLF